MIPKPLLSPRNQPISGINIFLALLLMQLPLACNSESTESPPDQEATPSPVAEKPTKETVLNIIKDYVSEIEQKGRILKTSSTWRTRLPKFPDLTFDDQSDYFWKLETNKGDMTLRLFHQSAPNHVVNYLYLTELGFFDDLIFHRVIQGFMAQGGCPQGDGRGDPGYRFAGEFGGPEKHTKRGILSMANSGPGTDGSQFFITFGATPHLDGNHTVFGEVVEGMDTLDRLEKSGSRGGSGSTSEKLKIKKASIVVKPSSD